MHQGDLWRERNRLMGEGVPLLEANRQALKNVEETLYGQADAAGAAADGLGEVGDAATEAAEKEKAAAEAAKNLSQIYTGLLSNMFAIQSQSENYSKSLADLDKEELDLTDKKKRAQYEASLYATQSDMERLQNKKKLNKEEIAQLNQMRGNYYSLLTDVQKYDSDLAEVQQKRLDLGKQQEQADKKRLYDMVQQKLAADGLINTPEFEYLQNLAVQKGLVSRASADQAIEENKLADSMVAAFDKTQPAINGSADALDRVFAYDGRTAHAYLVFEAVAAIPTMAYTGYTPGTTGMSYNVGGPTGTNRRAEGGPVAANTPYLVGERGPEMFVPQTAGRIQPNAGTTVNISVGAINSRADIDYLAQEVSRRIAKA